MSLAVAAAMASYASAQVDEGGPIVIGQQRRTDALYLAPPTAALELEAIYRKNENTTANEKNTFDETFFSEALSLETNGHIFSPSFIDLHLGADFGLTQSFTTANGEDGTQNGELLRWDLMGTYRRDSLTPFTAFSQREDQWIHREFGPSIESVTDNNGLRLDVRWPKAPTRFEVAHIVSEQNGLEDEDDFNYTRDRFSWYTVWRPNTSNTVIGNYQYNRVDQQGAIDAQYDMHELSLSHEYLFGKRRNHSLTSSLDYRAQSGDFELQSLRLAERMRLRHTERFETTYDYRFDYYDYPDTERMRNYGQVGFLHRLYESLTTTGNLSGSHSTEGPNDFSSTEWQGDLNIGYRKKVPLGRFFTDLGLRHNVQDNSERGDVTQFTDQAAAFADPLPIILPGSNVTTTGLVITDPSGLILYEEGTDYTVSQFPDRVEINRVVGGRIPNLSPVLVDYQVLPTPGNTTTTDNVNLHVRYELDKTFLRGLGVYVRYAVQDQSIDTDRPQDFVLNGYNDWLYGIDYRRGPFSIGAEQQSHNSDISPYDARRGFARYLQRYQYTTLSLNAAYTTIDHLDNGNVTELYTVSGQVRYAISRKMFVTGTVLWRTQNDTFGADLEGFEQQLELQWNHRQTTVFMQVRNSSLDTEDSKDSYQFFQLGVRREF